MPLPVSITNATDVPMMWLPEGNALIGEVFNRFNLANLSGRSGDLLDAGFGQATSRVTQVFGSGGPRSFQLPARISF